MQISYLNCICIDLKKIKFYMFSLTLRALMTTHNERSRHATDKNQVLPELQVGSVRMVHCFSAGCKAGRRKVFCVYDTVEA